MIIETPYPVSTNIYYRSFKNITTISKQGKLFKKTVQSLYTHITPTTENIILNIIIHPKLKKDGQPYSQLIDLDNCLKSILDSLIGIVYHDDKQVKELHACYGEPKFNGGTTISATKIKVAI